MPRPEFSIAQVMSGGNPVGLAFVIGDRQLLTCAHVVNAALGRDLRETSRPRPSDRLIVQFPFSAEDIDPPIRLGSVAMWHPTARDFERRDVAGLTLTGEPAPPEAVPLAVASSVELADYDVQLWGPSPDRITGGHVAGQLMGYVEPGRMQLDQDLRGTFHARRGFSGGPVWLRRSGELVGMLVAVALREGATDAYVIAAETLIEAWPQVLYRIPPSPFRGLEPFREEDALYYFGRQRFIEAIGDAVSTNKTLVLVGPSGSGKTSLLNAGLIPLLRERTPSPLLVTMQPGQEPLSRFAAQFARLSGGGSEGGLSDLEQWEDRARTFGLTECFDAIALLHDASGVILLIDQAEQLLTRASAERCRDFVELIANYLDHADIGHRIVFGIRDRYFGPLLMLNPIVADALQHSSVLLTEMTNDELYEAIERPIRVAVEPGRLRFDAGVIEQIQHDLEGSRAKLTLLQFTLSLLWSRQRNGVIGMASYHEAGGVTRALTSYADEQIDSMSAIEQKAASRILCRLVSPTNPDVSRPLPDGEIRGADRGVAGRLENSRLITSHRESDGRFSYELVHETLLTEWPRLRAWFDEARERLAWEAATEASSAEWQQNDRHPSLLLRGPVLARAQEMLTTFPEDSEHLRSFIGLSVRHENHEEELRRALLSRSEALRLALHAELARLSHPQGHTLALALGIESMLRTPTFEADQVLRRTLERTAIAALRLGHNKSVNAVAFSENEDRIATASADGTARLWDLSTGEQLLLLGHRGSVNDIALSRDGSLVATASSDRTVTVWDSRTGEAVMTGYHNATVSAVRFARTANRIASASADHTMRVWDIKSGVEIARAVHQNIVNSVAFGPGGRHVVSASDDGTARVTDIDGGQPIILSHQLWVFHATFSADGRWIATASADATACIWSGDEGRRIHTLLHRGPVQFVEFSPDSEVLATASADQTARLWRCSDGQEVNRLNHRGEVGMVAFSPDGKQIATTSADEMARVWSLKSEAESTILSHDTWVKSIGFSQSGDRLFTTADNDDYAWVWKASTGAAEVRIDHDGPVHSVAYCDDGASLVTASNSVPALHIWDVATGASSRSVQCEAVPREIVVHDQSGMIAMMSETAVAEILHLPTGRRFMARHDGLITSITFSTDGTQVATASADGTACVWLTSTGARLTQAHHGTWVNQVALSPQGDRFATAGVDGLVRLWSHGCSQHLATLEHDGGVNVAVFNSTGAQLATGADDLHARLWSIDGGHEMFRLAHNGAVTVVRFNVLGTQIATACANTVAQVWSALDGSEVFRLSHDGAVTDLRLSPDGRRIATASVDMSARVWDATSGEEVARLVHEGRVMSITFSPSGDVLATASTGHSVRLWALTPTRLIEQARERMTRQLTSSEREQFLPETTNVTTA